MKRVVNFATAKKLIKRDKFGTNLSEWVEFEAGKNELDILDKDAYYQSKTNERFFVYDGEGELELESECIKQYDFEHLNVFFLDFFLANQKHHKDADKTDKKLIDEFVTLLNSQFESDKPKFLPPYYAAIQAKLLNGL